MERCDTLFMVGTNFPYTKHLPEPGKVRVVQIEADPAVPGSGCRPRPGRRRCAKLCRRCCRCCAQTDRAFLERHRRT